MITQERLDEYIASVPPLSETLRETLAALERGDLAAAAKAASKDPALIRYLRQVVNSAAYGFRHEVKEAGPIFSALGIERAKQLLYAYLVAVTAPGKWRYFDIEKEAFREFQAGFMRRWEALVEALEAPEKYLSAAAILGAGLVVADALFGDHAGDVALLLSTEPLSLDEILERLSGRRFRELVAAIARKWEMDEEVVKLVALSFGGAECEEEPRCTLARMLHLLLFYELSRPVMMEAGANGFLNFDPAFVEPVLQRFQSIVELS
ncbi:HDOD domain-containing protein [Hydrogenimonas sp.]